MSRLFREHIAGRLPLARHLSYERPLSTVDEDAQQSDVSDGGALGPSENQLQVARPRRHRSAPVRGDSHAWQPLPGDTSYYIDSTQARALSQEMNVAESIFPSARDGLFVAYTGPCKNPDCYKTNSYRKRLTPSASIAIFCWACDEPLFRISNCSSDSSRSRHIVKRGRRRSSSPWLPSCFDVPFGVGSYDVLHEGFHEEPTRLPATLRGPNIHQRPQEGSQSPPFVFRGRYGSIDHAKNVSPADAAPDDGSHEAVSAEPAEPFVSGLRASRLRMIPKLRALLKRMGRKLRHVDTRTSACKNEGSGQSDDVPQTQEKDTSDEAVQRRSLDVIGKAAAGSNNEGSPPSTQHKSIHFNDQPTHWQYMRCRCTANCACMQQGHGTDRATSAGSEMRSFSSPSSTTRPPSSGSRMSPTTATFGIGAGMAHAVDQERRDSLMDESAEGG